MSKAAVAASSPVDHASYPDALIRRVLTSVKIIAMVGASANWNRPSFFAMKYLQIKGFRVIPVNPREVGKEILGEKVHAELADIPVKVDMVDVFRNSDAVPPIADEAIRIGAKVLWLQLGVKHPAAAAKAEQAGLTVIMNRCPKIEYGRLYGELGWSGINTNMISSKRRQVPKR